MKRDARQHKTTGQKSPIRPTIWDAVYAIVRRVPRGRVVTYGQIAKLLENRISPRYVGFAMHVCPKDVPWHRVVNATGGCSTDRLPGEQPCRQRILLEREGVRFRSSGTLSIANHQWSPRKRGMHC
ncbi:MAG: MGMT family protein [Acidobacteria bacterium]|nr:MGMT family protein [Acidobacteriota bacterium]